MVGWLLMAHLALVQPAVAPPPGSVAAPWLVEAGGYAWRVDQDLGWWRGAQLQARWRGHSRVVPAVFLETQTRPAGTQVTSAFMATLNFTPSVYAVTSVSLATGEDPVALYYPERRFDGKVYIKLPRNPQTVLVRNGSGGTASNTLTLTVNAPAISTITPDPGTPGSGTYTINGVNFNPATALVEVDGSVITPSSRTGTVV